jgi:hypothetical protein
MTTQTIRNGASIRLNVLPGQSVAVVAVSGTYNASIVQGAGLGVIATAATGGTYGPYASGIVILLTASAASEIDFDVAVTPVIVSDTLVTVSADPSTGGIKGFVAPAGSGYLLGANGFVPATNDYAGIMAAHDAAVAAGGGIVKLSGYFNIGSNTIPLADCVKYQGSGWKAPFQTGKLPPDEAFGTVIEGDGTADAFTGNITPAGSDTGGTTYMVHTGVSDLALVNFRRAVNAGAQNQRGLYCSIFENLAIHNCTDWGLYFENTEQLVLTNITLIGNSNGMYIGNSIPGFNAGDSPLIKFVYCQDSIGANTTYLSRHIWLNSRLGSLNSVCLEGSGANGPYYNQVFSVAGTATNGVADIACADTSRFAVGMPVILNATVTPFTAKKTYFIKSINPNVSIQLSALDSTDITTGINSEAAIVPTAGGAVSIKTRGFPGIQISASTGYAVTGCHLLNCNTENAGTGQILLQRANYCSIKGGEPSANISKFESTALWAAVLRDVYDCQVQFAHSGLIDSNSTWMGDAASNDGFPTTAMYANNAGNGLGVRGYGGFAGALYLYAQDSLPVLRRDVSAGYAFFGNGIALNGGPQGNGNTINMGQGNVITFNTGAGGSMTLPTAAVGIVGVVIMVSNPNAGVCTLNTAGGQNIIGLGASGTSIAIAANSSAMLVCCYNGSTYFWARFA